jgi:hypothetical protein
MRNGGAGAALMVMVGRREDRTRHSRHCSVTLVASLPQLLRATSRRNGKCSRLRRLAKT